jgi:hypothetical protein
MRMLESIALRANIVLLLLSCIVAYASAVSCTAAQMGYPAAFALGEASLCVNIQKMKQNGEMEDIFTCTPIDCLCDTGTNKFVCCPNGQGEPGRVLTVPSIMSPFVNDGVSGIPVCTNCATDNTDFFFEFCSTINNREVCTTRMKATCSECPISTESVLQCRQAIPDDWTYPTS